MFSFVLSTLKTVLYSFKFKTKRFLVLPTRPYYINLSYTYKCNGRCLMCDNWKRYKDNPQKVQQELTLGDYEKFFSDNEYWLSELRHIGIAGGEPFLRTDLVDLMRLIRKYQPKVSLGLQTNGLSPERVGETIKEIIEFYPQITLAVSLDGILTTHDKIRGVKGAYGKVLETISLAKNLGVKEINSGMTITEDNFSEILKVKEVVEEQGAKFSCFLADSGEYYNTDKKSDLSQKARESIIKALKNFQGDYYLDNLRLQMEGKRKRQLPCYSGWTSLVIDPYGEVRPCVLRSESFGNIKKQPLEEILAGEKAREIRKAVKKCSCWSICEATTSAVVDPWDVLWWFLFYADKKKFLASRSHSLTQKILAFLSS